MKSFLSSLSFGGDAPSYKESAVMDRVIHGHEDEAVDDANEKLNLSNSFIFGNVGTSTKRQYVAQLLNFKIWLQVKQNLL